MEISKSDVDGVTKLEICGRLDAVSANDADKTFNDVMGEGISKLLINLSGLEYISSAGLRSLLKVAKQMKQQSGKIVLCSLTDSVKEVFEISGFSSIFVIKDNEDAALAEFF